MYVVTLDHCRRLMWDHVLSLDFYKVNASLACNLEASNCCVNHELAGNEGCPLFSRGFLWARWHSAIH